MRTFRMFLVVLAAIVTAVLAFTGPAFAATAEPSTAPQDPDPSLSHHLATSYVSTYPSSTDSPQCRRDNISLSGMYSFGQQYGAYGRSWDRDGIELHGIYTWSDCLLPTDLGWLQVSRLRPAGTQDNGVDAVSIANLRTFPSLNGVLTWGSVLSLTTT